MLSAWNLCQHLLLGKLYTPCNMATDASLFFYSGFQHFSTSEETRTRGQLCPGGGFQEDRRSNRVFWKLNRGDTELRCIRVLQLSLSNLRTEYAILRTARFFLFQIHFLGSLPRFEMCRASLSINRRNRNQSHLKICFVALVEQTCRDEI